MNIYRSILLYLLAGWFFLGVSQAQLQFSAELWEDSREDTLLIRKFSSLRDVAMVEPLQFEGNFQGKFKLKIRQPIDHKNPEKGTFLQTIYINHSGFDKPTVFITEGYDAAYAGFPAYENELTHYLNANQICAEHRYFGESVPEKMDWQYLTVENSAADLHHILDILKTIYSGKWISTGISKGGQTALYHRTLYPEDVDLTVSYVNPLNEGVEDGRHEPFIKQNGEEPERSQVERFQLTLLQNRDSLMPKFNRHIDEKGYTFRISREEVYDYCVLEYSFAYWQWHPETNAIPDIHASNDEIFEHFVSFSSPDYFSEQSLTRFQPFFIQAAMQLGYYGYDTEPFDSLLTISHAEGYLYTIFLPDSVCFPYDDYINEKVREFLKNKDPEIIFIYGEWDPWTASSVFIPEKTNLYKFVKPGGNHATRIANMPDPMKNEILMIIDRWLDSP